MPPERPLHEHPGDLDNLAIGHGLRARLPYGLRAERRVTEHFPRTDQPQDGLPTPRVVRPTELRQASVEDIESVACVAFPVDDLAALVPAPGRRRADPVQELAALPLLPPNFLGRGRQ